jgi:hypothetical protein
MGCEQYRLCAQRCIVYEGQDITVLASDGRWLLAGIAMRLPVHIC